MGEKLCIGDYPQEELEGKIVLVRVDYNVPLRRNHDSVLEVSNDARIRDSLKTIQFLLGGKANIILISHMGRPKSACEDYSLRPAAKKLQELLGDTQVDFCDDCIDFTVSDRIARMPTGSIIVLENLRFHPEEINNDLSFAQKLAQGKDLFVNDAFSACHREHASVHAIANYFDKIYCGISLQKEIKYLQNAIDNPRRPFAAVIGGAKVSTKLHVFEHLLDIADVICIGGAMVFTFYRALGHDVGDCFVENDLVEVAASILKKASKANTIFRLATDIVISNSKQMESLSVTQNAGNLITQIVPYDTIPSGWQGLDIGPTTIRDFEQEIYRCQTIVWNGPMGKYEEANFRSGTDHLIRIMTDCTKRGATTIACGGDTVAAIETFTEGTFTHLSMGGGASLAMLGGEKLPGVEVISVGPDSLTCSSL